MSATRRLAAILSADVVGYSRLMETDEVGTLAALKALRKDILEPLVAQYQGRIFKIAGDAVLIEFASPVNAVQCAIDLQDRMAVANKDVLGDRQINLRIGINLGDVMVEGSDLYGDGVNIAARLESMAEPGGVLVSESAYDHVTNKVGTRFDDLGLRNLKNIAKPIRVYRAEMSNETRPAAASGSSAKEPARSDKVSIAILPFDNMSGDPEQGYFSDGITEDIITELSRYQGLLVIARNSSFQFRAKAIDVKEVAQKLGVEFVVEGSVRKSGNRVRVTVQLIDAVSTAHIWAERYDRDLTDIFEIQDEVVREIAGAIPGYLGRIATDRARRKPTSDLTAHDYLLRARWAVREIYDLSLAIEHLKKAIEIDPDCAPAHALISWAYSLGLYNLGLDPDVAVAEAYKHSALALAIDSADPEVLASAAMCDILLSQHEFADIHSKRAWESNPNDSLTNLIRGLVLAYLGRHTQAMERFAHIKKIDPIAKDQTLEESIADCLFMMGEYEKVAGIYRTWLNLPIHLRIVEAATYALLGRKEEAAAALEKFNQSQLPKPDPLTMIRYQVRMCARPEDRDRWLEGYRTAGFDV